MKGDSDPVMSRVRELFAESGFSQEELGQGMGYKPDLARKSAWQFLQRTKDPRVSMLRKFAAALKIPLSDLVSDQPNRRAR